MTDGEGLARIIISAACCAAIIVCSFCNFLFHDSITVSGADPIINNTSDIFFPSDVSSEENSTSENEKSTKDADSSQKENSSSSEAQSKVVEASGSGKTAGAVIEKFISPYTANTSHNNVYLKNSTGLEINIKELLSSPLKYNIEKNGEPQVLIVHTHATETFLSEDKDYYTNADATRTTDNSLNMVSIGKIVADRLNGAGIKTLHSTVQHDYPEYNNSYSRSASTISSYLKKYPSIKIVIDLHRDAIASSDTDKVKLTTEINGKKAAQIMIVMGSQSGNITNFPNWKENLKLAVRLQQTIEVMYPSLARALSLVSRNYNESLTTGSMLIEIGTDGNSIEEARYTAELLSDSLISLLNTLE